MLLFRSFLIVIFDIIVLSNAKTPSERLQIERIFISRDKIYSATKQDDCLQFCSSKRSHIALWESDNASWDRNCICFCKKDEIISDTFCVNPASIHNDCFTCFASEEFEYKNGACDLSSKDMTDCRISDIFFDNGGWKRFDEINILKLFTLHKNQLQLEYRNCLKNFLPGLLLKIELACFATEYVCLLYQIDGNMTVGIETTEKVKHEAINCLTDKHSFAPSINPSSSLVDSAAFSHSLTPALSTFHDFKSTTAFQSTTTRSSSTLMITASTPTRTVMSTLPAYRLNYHFGVSSGGNNVILLIIAGVTVALCISVIVVTVTLVYRRDMREKRQNLESHYSLDNSCDNNESFVDRVEQKPDDVYVISNGGIKTVIQNQLHEGLTKETIHLNGIISNQSEDLNVGNKTNNETNPFPFGPSFTLSKQSSDNETVFKPRRKTWGVFDRKAEQSYFKSKSDKNHNVPTSINLIGQSGSGLGFDNNAFDKTNNY